MNACDEAVERYRDRFPLEGVPVRRRVAPSKVFSHFAIQVHDREGHERWSSGFKRNLTTDTAVGYTNRRDWQSKAMGGGFAAFATAVGAATATSATSLTNSGAAFPTAGQALAGCIVAVGPNSSGAGSTVYGVIVSNTATVLTVDQWYTAGTRAVGTTPNATANYQVLIGQHPASYLAVTSDVTAPSAADTTLTSEATTNGFARAQAIWAHTAAATTYTMQVVFNATGSLTPAKMAAFGAANPTAGGVMPFETAIGSPPALNSGDQLTLTHTITVS